jgi:hypothetical protein
MGKAAPQAAGTGVLGNYALAELRWGWGEAYRIGWDAAVRGWWANRRDGADEDIKAADRHGLLQAIYADYTASSVTRGCFAPLPEPVPCKVAS